MILHLQETNLVIQILIERQGLKIVSIAIANFARN